MRVFLLAQVFIVCVFPILGQVYPGPSPGRAQLRQDAGRFILENDHLKASWALRGETLTAPTLSNKVSGELFVPGRELFGLATHATLQDPDWLYLGMRRTDKGIEALVSSDGNAWESLVLLPAAEFPGKLKCVRIGKTSSQGQADDYASAGELGSCEIQQVQSFSEAGQIQDLTSKPERIHRSKRTGTTLEIANEQISIEAHANSAVFAEYSAPANWTLIRCKVKKGSDKGMSWGPGLTLIFDDGRFALVNIRGQGHFTVQSRAGERLIDKQPGASLSCDLSSNDFVLSGRVKTLRKDAAQTLQATFKHSPSGLFVRWTATLRDGSNYVRQRFAIAATRECTLHGIQLVSGQAKGARQIGTVPGSPVASESLFFGVEMPFTVHFFEDNGFRSGFGCKLPLAGDTIYEFDSVLGVFPRGQLRRAFNYYLERERSTPSHQFLHYNCWYDLGLNPTRESFTEVIEAYDRELKQKRGVTLDSFVMDDGWDDFNAGLWEYNRKKFPNGFDEVAKAARKAHSNLGVWISPLGGYSGADQRRAHARKMGLIEDSLDLSQPGYYRWFYQKCLGLMKEHRVNYFKWDKAGSGVSPHFMALLRCGRELKKHNPDLFINVTVGTWPSPFWLNHIDCTWRTGTGDVAWYGVGDEREQWLTFRDWGCYTKFVQPAPLYPLNSVMHHGLVLGRHFQGIKVAKAGADFKNAARSFFGTGANLQELYLTPDLMTDTAWDQIAEAAKWAKRNEKILIDSHWVGGNPLDLGIYGWASWSPTKSLLTLRNSSDQVRELRVDLATAFEIPEGEAQRFQVKNAYPDQSFQERELEGDVSFRLQPFEVICLEFFPVQ